MEIVSGLRVWEWFHYTVWKKAGLACLLTAFLGYLYTSALAQVDVVIETGRETVYVNHVQMTPKSTIGVDYLNHKISEVLARREITVETAVNAEYGDVRVREVKAAVSIPLRSADGVSVASKGTVSADMNAEGSGIADATVTDIIADTNIADTNTADTNVPDTETVPAVSVWDVTFYGNGGAPEVMNHSFTGETLAPETVEAPKKLGKVFDGWYMDAECTIPFTGAEVSNTKISLYAKWREPDGVVCDENGYITGFSNLNLLVKDGLLVLPRQEMCKGITASAFAGAGADVYEIYIPANIEYIETGTFEALPNLLYIEADKGNPKYYSENGTLYFKDGTVMAAPQG